MRDGLGQPQSLAVLGGTSDIGRAVAAELARSRCRRVVLAGRDQVRLERAAEQLKVAGATQVRTTLFEATDRSGHDRLVADVFGQGDVDVVLFAFGELGHQDALTEDADAAARLADVNYTATVSLGLRVAKAMRGQGHGSQPSGTWTIAARATARWSSCPRWPRSAGVGPPSSTGRPRPASTPSPRVWVTRCTAAECTSSSCDPASCGPG